MFLFEILLDRNVLYLACRHHIHEILMEKSFSTTMGPSSVREILLFKRFKTFWPNIVHADYKPGVDVSSLAADLLHVSKIVCDRSAATTDEETTENSFNSH